MHRSKRTVARGLVFATFSQSGQTLVAGCSIALWLLQLVMLTPLEEYVACLPWQVRCPEVYVDDATVLVIGQVGTVEDIVVKAAVGLIKAFVGGAGLPISLTKGQVTVSLIQSQMGSRSTCGELGSRAPGRSQYLGSAVWRGVATCTVDSEAECRRSPSEQGVFATEEGWSKLA